VLQVIKTSDVVFAIKSARTNSETMEPIAPSQVLTEEEQDILGSLEIRHLITMLLKEDVKMITAKDVNKMD
jgi:hypothetical protein